jgi:hypothetical protein
MESNDSGRKGCAIMLAVRDRRRNARVGENASDQVLDFYGTFGLSERKLLLHREEASGVYT